MYFNEGHCFIMLLNVTAGKKIFGSLTSPKAEGI